MWIRVILQQPIQKSPPNSNSNDAKATLSAPPLIPTINLSFLEKRLFDKIYSENLLFIV